ncbi:protein C19orf12 homolog isoform X2 [Clarias gariepinus]|nr:protein C19orf12 homolog isoform X2 [Clarias gariepinus]
MTSGQFKPLPQVIMEMTPEQQQKLYENVMDILGSIEWTDVAQLMAIVTGSASLQQQVIAALLSYVHKELQAEVHYVD